MQTSALRVAEPAQSKENCTLLLDEDVANSMIRYGISEQDAWMTISAFRMAARLQGTDDRVKICAKFPRGLQAKNMVNIAGITQQCHTLVWTQDFHDPPTRESWVLWTGRPVRRSIQETIRTQKRLVDDFKDLYSISGDLCEVSFGSFTHLSHLILSCYRDTSRAPLNGLKVRTETMISGYKNLRINLGWDQEHGLLDGAIKKEQQGVGDVGIFFVGVVEVPVGVIDRTIET